MSVLRSMNDWRPAALAIGSSLLALLCAEGLLRLIPSNEELGIGAHPFLNRRLGAADVSALRRAMRQMEPAAPPPDIPGEWFLEDPPPLTNRSVPSPEMVSRWREFQKRGILPWVAEWVWNRVYAQRDGCNAQAQFEFTKFPGGVRVFEPPAGSIHPFYRFPVNATLPSGLVTNQYGLRGPPIDLKKPAGTIRIAFVGASTTVNQHWFPFSYPERVIYWLNRFATAGGYQLHFEGLNAGREGINSADIAAIVRDEVAALDPDLVVYYEGANQFAAAQMISPPTPSRKQYPYGLLQYSLKHLRIGQLFELVALNPWLRMEEPVKPAYHLVWNAGVDENNPHADDPRLPLQLPAIVKDLDQIREAIKPSGGQLIVCSFEWLASGGMRLAPSTHRYIFEQLNTVLWPLRYADIRRLADFQNRVFGRYAESRGIPFLDVAGRLPQTPDLFVDAIHMTETGERVKAWIVFQQLAPLIRGWIEGGRLPRPASPALPPPANLSESTMPLRCG